MEENIRIVARSRTSGAISVYTCSPAAEAHDRGQVEAHGYDALGRLVPEQPYSDAWAIHRDEAGAYNSDGRGARVGWVAPYDA